MNIKKEEKKVRQKKLKVLDKKNGEKTFKLVDEPLKVQIEKLSADDSFWN